MIFLQTQEEVEITEYIEKQVLECALVFQDWRKRLLFVKSNGDTISQMNEPTWDAQPFTQYRDLQKFNISPEEWNLNSILALKDSQDWGLLYIPTDYSSLNAQIGMYLDDRSNHDLFCAARHSVINFINQRFIGETKINLHIKNDQLNCLLYVFTYLSDQRNSEIEFSYILHVLIFDYVFLKLCSKLKMYTNDDFNAKSGSLDLSYCIRISDNVSNNSSFPIYIPAYNVNDPIPFRGIPYLKHLLHKFIHRVDVDEVPRVAKGAAVDSLCEYDTIIKTSFKYYSNNSHKVIDLIAKIPVIRASGELGVEFIPAAYCYGCNEYYILIDDYTHMRGIPLCRVYSTISIERVYFSTQKFLNYQYQSIIFAYGYNVNANNNISVHQRRTILKEIINKKILSRVEVISHLKFLIAINKNKPQFSSAIKKWENDKQYIEDYITEEPSFTVNEIYIR